jgi:integrase/recombinase XerD
MCLLRHFWVIIGGKDPKKRGLRMKKSDIELDEFQTYLREKGNREKTIEDYGRHITNFQKWLLSEGSSLEHVTRYDIQQYIKHLQSKGNKASTLNPKYSAMVAYARYMGKPYLVENIQRPEFAT